MILKLKCNVTLERCSQRGAVRSSCGSSCGRLLPVPVPVPVLPLHSLQDVMFRWRSVRGTFRLAMCVFHVNVKSSIGQNAWQTDIGLHYARFDLKVNFPSSLPMLKRNVPRGAVVCFKICLCYNCS